MELESTIVTINNLLKLSFKDSFGDFLNPQIQIISIPDYQREYKWEAAKIKTFVKNIMQKSKFLGIITVEETHSNLLSLVDGQQRLTTIFLMLAQLYNACANEGETATQDEVEALVTCTIDGQTILKLENNSVGKYLYFGRTENESRIIDLRIDDKSDIYKQSEKFIEAWNIIGEEISTMRQRYPDTSLDIYKQRLLDCEVLLFAQKNTDKMQQGSSEEIYIDINEKAQKLDPEDIFKGHCFAICKADSQQKQVKELWRSIKQNFFSMENILKKANMGNFLHFYFLTQEATQPQCHNIKKDLTINGENIITHRYNTPTKVINMLKDINTYQINNLDFMRKITTIQYLFSDIINASPQILGNNRERIKEFSTILTNIITCNQNLFKLPLFYLIDEYYRKAPVDKLSYDQFSYFLYFYYIYMFLFSRLHGPKKREGLPNNLIRQIQTNDNFLIEFIKEIEKYANSFDISIDEKILKDEESRKHLYTILDYFKASPKSNPTSADKELIVKFQLFPETYNREHLIINQSRKIVWHSTDANIEYIFTKDDFDNCPAWNAPNNCWANFIWIDSDFNKNVLKNKDIVNKMLNLRGTYKADEEPHNNSCAKKHQHIELICQHIMSTDGYAELLTAYANNESRDKVLMSYQKLINEYFSEDSLDNLCNTLSEKYSSKLQELYRLKSPR